MGKVKQPTQCLFIKTNSQGETTFDNETFAELSFVAYVRASQRLFTEETKKKLEEADIDTKTLEDLLSHFSADMCATMASMFFHPEKAIMDITKEIGMEVKVGNENSYHKFKRGEELTEEDFIDEEDANIPKAGGIS